MRYYAVTSKDGAAQLHPFKDWFRTTQNVANAPQMNTHQMRDHMKRLGWGVRESPDQVLIMEPGTESIPSLVGDADDLDGAGSQESSKSAEASLFALESHLRDYLAKNLNATIKLDAKLEVVGVEHTTDVGPIDLLAKSKSGDYYVFEFKLQRGADAALGQLLRYMGWCKKHMAVDKKVFGIILAADISEKLRYAASLVPDVALLEYELQIKVRPVPEI